MRHGDVIWNRCLRIFGPSFDVRCERTLSDQLSPLSPPLLLPSLPLYAPLQRFLQCPLTALRSRSALIRFSDRSAPFSAPLTFSVWSVLPSRPPLRTLSAGFVTVHFFETHNCDQITTQIFCSELRCRHRLQAYVHSYVFVFITSIICKQSVIYIHI